MAAEKRRFSFTNLFKNTTPKPQDRQIYNLGIQEKNTSYVINPTVIYNIASQSTILRTCTTQLKNEIFRRGYVWEEAFTVKCNDCGKVHKSATLECKDCGSTNLKKPDLILVKEYFLDSDGKIKMHRIKEVYRGDPVTMHIYSDDLGQKGIDGYTCLVHRETLATDMIEKCDVCGSKLHPVHYVNRAKGKHQHYVKGEVLHFSKYSPSRMYGMSPIITLWNNVTTEEYFLFKLEILIQ